MVLVSILFWFVERFLSLGDKTRRNLKVKGLEYSWDPNGTSAANILSPLRQRLLSLDGIWLWVAIQCTAINEWWTSAANLFFHFYSFRQRLSLGEMALANLHQWLSFHPSICYSIGRLLTPITSLTNNWTDFKGIDLKVQCW